MEILELEPQAHDAAELLSAMAHEKRLLILCHLVKNELSVSTLAERLKLPQPTLSQHLAKLRDLKLVATRRDGNVVYYHLASPQVEEVLCALHNGYCANEPDLA